MKNSTLSFNHKRGVSSDTLWRKSYQTILSVLLGLALIFGTTLQLTAQVTAYTWSQSSGTYTAITGTQVLAAGSDDLSSATQTLPFTFTFDGQAQTTYVANSNGNIRFGGVAPTAQYSPISTTSNTNSISPFGRDGRTGGAVVSTVQGATPNRVFIIQYPNWNPAYFSAATTLDFQIRLYETTNVVEVVYGASVRTASYTGEVGIRGNLAVASNFNNRTTASNWASATSGIATSMITLSTTVFPASGLTYTWTPPAPPTFCASSANSSFDEVITNVSLGSLNNTTVCGITAPGAGSIANQYGNYTTLTAPNLNIGVSYPASVSVGTCGGYYGTFTNTYIDWNGDQDFLDAGETVYTSLSTPGAATLTYNVLVPAGTVPGLKRMRIVHVESAAPSSCGTYFYGETEDYNVNIVAAPTFCASSANSSFDEVITNVSLGSLNNTTVCGITAPGAGSIANQYGNYTTLTAPNLNIGVSYPASVSVGTCGGYYGTFTNTYIDWNGDQDFLDAGETVYTSLSTPGAATLTYNVLVPAGTVPGLKRMRIVHVESAAPSSCGTYFYGETEDYNVNIVAAPACLAPTLSTVAATCSSPGTATVSNYDATSTYVSTPAGATVGALGVITATAGTAYTLTAANATCGALVASASFTIDVQLTEPVAPAVTTTVATCTSPGTATVSNYDSTSTYVSTPVGATVGALGVITATAGTAYTLTAANATCTSVASASFTNDVQLPEPVAPSVTTTAASCTSPGTATVSNYDSTSIYVSTPVGATVGVLGVITATAGTAYTLTAANATCTSVASASFTNDVQLPEPVAPSVTTTAASCTSPGTATVSNYDSTSIYVSTPVGATVGVLGVITATSGTAYTLTAANATCTSVASVSFTNDVQLPEPVAPSVTTAVATCTSPGTATVSNYDSTSTYVSTPVGATVGALGVITATAGTAYTLTAANATCTSVASVSVTIAVQLAAPVAVATDNGDATLTATAGTGYVWIDCATNTAIAGATAQTFAPTVNGNYAVVLTNAAGCSDTSVCVTIANIGIKEIAGTGVSIYPNPTSSDVVINFPSNSASIEVMDATGKVVSTSTITTGGKVTLADFNRGIYYIRLNTENATSIHKVIKN